MKYYIIAGEASGDLHASNLIKEIRKNDPDAVFRAWGGDLMEKEGVDIVKHYRELAFMGFIEVAANIYTILNNLKLCKKDILDWKPDMVILVDYPGFNLRIAEYVHSLKIPVVYYISPQLWAWKKGRVELVRSYVDKMICILPFEKAFYADYNVDVEFVGHPLLDAVPDAKPTNDDENIIALLPGSRKQEVSTVLPIMLKAGAELKEYKMVLAVAPGLEENWIRTFTKGYNVELKFASTYDVISSAKVAMVTSGTATLETALLNVPEVVCYKGSFISYTIARRLVDIKYISLVNLIMDKEVVKELIQSDLTVTKLKNEIKMLLPGGKNREKMLLEYDELKQVLGGGGASKRAASIIDEMFKKAEK